MLAALTVNSPLDNVTSGDGLVTLREAVIAANNDTATDLGQTGNGADSIGFDAALSNQTITLGGTELAITEALTIDATALAQNVIVDANFQSRIINITAATGNFTLAGLTLTRGLTLGSDEVGGAIRSITTGNLTIDRSTVSGNRTAGFAAYGGGVYSQGAVTFTDSTVSGNSTADTFARGGGIYSQLAVTLTDSTVSGNRTTGLAADGGGISSKGTVTLTGSTVSGNFTTAQSADGGGIFSLAGAAVTLTSSTVSGNSTAGNSADGGGIYSKGAVTLVHSTITDNHAYHATAFGGGVWNDNDPVVITNSIVADNTDGGSMDDIRPGSGSLNINFSLIADIVGLVITGSNNITGFGAILGPLASNGGLTQTHAPLIGSMAVNAGDPGFTSPPDFDQRGTGFPRVSLGRIDMGAYELQAPVQGLVVDTATDVIDGDFTIGNLALREAVLFANLDPLANTITFDASLSGQTITLGGSQLLITDTLTIDATALAANVTIDANMQSRVIKVDAFPSGNLTLSGLTITGGRTLGEFDDGGGIRFSGDTLTLNSSTVSGNSTLGNLAYGGGIWTFSGDVTLTDSTVSDNSTSGSDANGGGIRTYSGAVTLTDSTVSGNSTAGALADGGGIRTYTGAVTLTDSTVSDNSTTGSATDGGGIYTNSGAVTLTNSTISGNSSADDGGGIYTNSGAVTLMVSTVSDNSSDYNGGGIYTASGAVTLTSSTVSGNSATEFFARGGGIATGSGDVTLTDSTVSGNSAIGTIASGGGIWAFSGDVTLTSSTVSGNSSDNDGGGIRTSFGRVTLTNSTVIGNSAADDGGGVYVRDTATNPRLTITNSIVAGNTAGDEGPDLRPDPDSTRNVDFSLIGDTTDSGITAGTGTGNILNQSAQLGPLIDNGGPTLTHAPRVGSPAIDSGDPGFSSPPNFDQRGAPFVREAGLRIDIGAYERQTVAGLNLTVDTNVDENDGDYSAGDLSLREAVGLANGSIGADTILFAAALSGQTITLGGSQLLITDTLTIDATALAANVTIDANMQSRVLDVDAFPSGNLTLSGLLITGGRTIGEFDDGGGIRFFGDTLTLNSSTVSGNSTTGDLAHGGGIWTYSGDVTLNNSTVSDNSTSGLNAFGGGIRSGPGAVTLTGSTVSGNSTTGDLAPGGGIFTYSGAVTLTDSTVSDNSTTGFFAEGGGIRTYDGSVTLTDSTVSGNSTSGKNAEGGGIFTSFYDSMPTGSNGAVTLTGSTVSGNSTTGTDAYGGGIRTHTGAVTLTRSTVSSNNATGSFAGGGGVRTINGAVTLTDSTVSDNFSGNRGGGIFTPFGAVTLTGSTVSGNVSVDNGGGIRTHSSVVTLTSSTVTGNLAYGAGGGVSFEDSTTNPTLTIANSIVAGNTDNGTAADLRTDPGSTLNVDFSLVGDTTGSGITAGTGSGNILNQPALLGPLADNSGPTLTHALLVGSLAIDAGNPGFTSPPNFDQRGAPFAREAGLRIDMGAYERQALDPSFFIVTTTTDELDYSNADVSLREAIHSANGSIGADTILFAAALSGQTITLGGTELQIIEALTIDATALATNVTIDANMQSRVLRFTANTGDLTLSGLTITGGQTTELLDNGGGIRFDSAGTLTLNSSTLSGNKTTGSGLRGGGIFTYNGAVTLNDSTVSDNSTSGANANGGGIRTYSGDVTLSNSTVSGNSTAGTFSAGGGISTYSGAVTLTNSTVSGNVSADVGGGIYTESTVTLMGSTVTGNTAAGAGGGVYVTDTGFNPTLTIANSIVAGNTDNGTAADLRPDPDSTLVVDFSLIGDTTGSGITGGTGSGNILNQPALLGPLADNSGPTLTHALLVGSLAIDAGDPAILFDAAEFDQRGNPYRRVFGGRIDIGAFEAQPIPGDFDGDGDSDSDDLAQWADSYGLNADGDSDFDGDSDGADFLNWQRTIGDGVDLGFWESQFGQPAPLVALSSLSASGQASEEPLLESVVVAAPAPLSSAFQQAVVSIEAVPVSVAEKSLVTFATPTSVELASAAQAVSGFSTIILRTSGFESHLNTVRDNISEMNGFAEYVDMAFEQAWDVLDSSAHEYGNLVRKIANYVESGHRKSHARVADDFFATLAEEEGFARLRPPL